MNSGCSYSTVRATVSGATSRTSFSVTDQSRLAGRFWRMFMPYVMDGGVPEGSPDLKFHAA